MTEILLIGEALVDVVVGPNGTALGEHPGGSPANVAVGLARLQHSATLLAHLADDAHGRLVRDHLDASGVHLAPGSLDAARTPTATAHLSESGAAEYDFDITWDLPPDLPAGLTAGPGAVSALHTGSIAAVMAPGADRVEQIWRAASAVATLSFDPNVRPSIIGDGAAEARERIGRFVASADLIKVSDEDLAWLEPGTDPDDVATRWLKAGPAMVVVTRGGAGATAFTRSGRVDRTAPQITVVDTVGAGDSFMGGLLDGLARRGLLGAARRDDLRDIGVGAVESVVAHAVQIAAITCSRPGADPPSRQELDALNG